MLALRRQPPPLGARNRAQCVPFTRGTPIAIPNRMEPIGQHLMLRLEDDRVIAPSVAARRALARCVLRCGRPFGLLAFAAPDTHLHLLALCSALLAAELCRRVAISLSKTLRPEARFRRYHAKPLINQAHTYSAFRYLLRQGEHHNVDVDPLGDASNLPDLLGMRICGSYTQRRVIEHLPRIKRVELLSRLPVASELLERPCRKLDGLADAAAAAIGAPALVGRGSDVRAARAAATQLAAPMLTVRETADLLGISKRSVIRMRQQRVPLELARAVVLQARARAALSSTAGAIAGPDWKCGSVVAPELALWVPERRNIAADGAQTDRKCQNR
jgi:hypothetical protein